jgi:hypothetical protein
MATEITKTDNVKDPATITREWEEKLWREVIRQVVDSIPNGSQGDLIDSLRKKYSIGKY